jgi:mediator of RNA polymerase II transcription subunit 12, fungi type
MAELVDFFPWNGTHPEDSLTEGVIKNGFVNKAQIMNENGTARPAVWTHLKNKSGLQTLSSLFIAMLEKRQNAGRLTAPSSFKPPPRVTLTDTKREAWLRDLANPAIALRRLSRTIPHGIRGKLLLEQCLSKNIPTPRAVWLAKCVGANEMRAFKRKGATGNVGVGSEVKWVKEWTSFVEQFVESIVSTCGQAGWKAKMDYS